MKSSTIAESATPAACICAIFSLAGCEKLQPSMLQLATVSGQPHWHASLAPTRRIFWFELAIWAVAAVVRSRITSVAHALLRAASRLFSTHELSTGVEKSLDAARRSACATLL